MVLLRLLLTGAGWEVDAALDVRSALGFLKEKAYDWLVVDGQLRPMDGFELAERAKVIQPRLRIAMISGVYEAVDVRDRPIAAFFPKPVDVDALIARLRQAEPAV